MSGKITVRHGAVYLSAEVAETYFKGIAAVIVLIRDGHLDVLPVRHAAAGGSLLKIRNAAGDRVASAPDVFAEYDLGDWEAEGLPASWSAERGALRAPLPPLNAN